MNRAEIQKRVNDYQRKIDYYLERREVVEKDLLKSKSELHQIENKLEQLTKQMLKLIVEKNK